MRSILLALALAAPMSAVAAPNTFTRPTRVHVQKPEMVFMTFANFSSQDREVVAGDVAYKIRSFERKNIELPVGSDVRLYSETNSKIHGQVLMQVSANDLNREVILH